MSVFIRKFKPGGPVDSDTDAKELSTLNVLFGIRDHKISAEDFAKDLEDNFSKFEAAYGGTWTEKEKRDVIDTHNLFLLNLRAGNITGIDSNGRFTVLDPGYSGMDFDLAGGWGKYSYYVKRVADSERIVPSMKETTPKKKFTNTSILQDIYNKFFGGTQNADYRSFFDLDEVVEQNGKKVRGVKNRVNALLDLLNENYMSQYDDADEAFGGIEGATERVDRLRTALASGKLDNEDFAAAAALGLNLRGLLSTDGNIDFDENGNFKASSTETESESAATTKTAEEQLKEILYGPQTSTQEVVDTINGWDTNLSQSVNLGINPNYRTGDYIKERILQSGDKNLDQYYKNTFFPAFFENLKIYTPEYINSHPNETKEVWNNKNQPLKEYVGLNLLIAIRNKLYGNSSLLSKDVDDNLNNIVGTNLWTVPGSFDEKTGTVALFDVVTGDYKRVSIKNNNLKIIPKGAKNNETVSLLQDYALSKLGVPSSKKGGKLQLGGTINNLSGASISDEEKRKAFEQMFLATPEPTAPKTTTTETISDKTSSTDKPLGTHASEALYKDGQWNLETEDYARATSLIADIVSLAGGAVGLGAGLTSTVSDVVGDAADESLTKLDVAKNALINLGWTAAGFIPGAKLGKIGRALFKWGPRAIMVFDTMGLIKNETQRSVLKKIIKTGEITSEDFNVLTQMGRAATGLTMGAKAMKREHIYNKGKVEVSDIDIKVSKGDTNLTVSVTPGELESLNTTGRKYGLTKANEKLQEILRGKHVDPEEAKKFTLRDVDFGEPGKFDYFRETRYKGKKVAEEKRTYTEPSAAHRHYLEENYGKYLKLENNGEGYNLPSIIPEIHPIRRAKSWLYGDSRYDRSIQEFNENNSRTAAETPAAEPRVNENQAATSEGSSNGSSVSEAPANGGNQAAATEAPASETPAPVIPRTSKDRRVDITKRATELLNTIENLSKQERKELNRIKKLVKNGELQKEKYISLSETLDNIKNRTFNVANGTNNNANRIGQSRNGSKLQAIVNLKREGGIIFAQSGIKVGGQYNWYNNIFSKYSNRILNNLKQYKDEYAKWLNGMQGYHAEMKQKAGTNWNNIAYRNKSVKDYLDLYTKGYGDDNNYYNLNGIQSGLDTEGHYDIFGNTKRNNLERSGFKSDGLFSQMTDDRRLLGRRDDWNPEKLNEWKAKLNELGYDMVLGTDDYYRIVTLDDSNKPDSDSVAGSTDPNAKESSVESGDSGSGSNGALFDGGDEGTGSNVRRTDYYQYLPATIALARMIGDNEATRRRTDKYLRKLQVPLQLTYRFGRLVHGDYATKAMYENQAAAVRQQMSRPLTSDAQLAALKQLEGERLASDLIAKGNLADNEMIRKTGELAAQEEKENLINATKTANANRALMAEDARYRAGVRAAADTAIHNNFDNWLMNYVEKPIQEEAYRRKAYQDYYNYLMMGPMEYDASTDPVVIDYQRQLAAIPADDPERATKRTQILEAVQDHIRTQSEIYKSKQLAKFRVLNPYIYQPFPFEFNVKTSEKPDLAMDFDKKGGILKRLRDVPKNAKGGLISEGYPAAVIRAKSKDNDRLIKLILEVIRNHKDLAKGVRITDYSKYIVK